MGYGGEIEDPKRFWGFGFGPSGRLTLVKVPEVERLTNRSYSVNLPVALAEAIDTRKGEDMERGLDGRNTWVLSRTKLKRPSRKVPQTPWVDAYA